MKHLIDQLRISVNFFFFQLIRYKLTLLGFRLVHIIVVWDIHNIFFTNLGRYYLDI